MFPSWLNKEKIIEYLLLTLALVAISILAAIAIVIFVWGLPIFVKVGLGKFLFGTKWAPTRGIFGIFPMIIGSLAVTFGALLISVPLGLACAIFLAEIAPKSVSRVVRALIQLLAGIPSVVYGFVGLIFLVPFIRANLGGPGLSVLAASCILGVMVLPTVISISQDSIEAVPRSYKEGSLALGATHWQTIRRVLIPAAKSGIFAGVILGMGRAIGETMCVIMVIGNAVKIPISPLSPARTLTSNIALELAYAAGDHRLALFATGLVLFVFIMALNITANFAFRQKRSK